MLSRVTRFRDPTVRTMTAFLGRRPALSRWLAAAALGGLMAPCPHQAPAPSAAATPASRCGRPVLDLGPNRPLPISKISSYVHPAGEDALR